MIVGKLMVVLGLDSTGFNTGINAATKKSTLFASATDKTFKLISKAAKLSLLAISAAFVKGTIDAAKFEKALANVSTMLDKNTMPMMKDFKTGILALSEAYGDSTDALAKGLYDILSASIPAAKAMGVLKTSAMAAVAGLTDTGVAADAITTLINSFGDATKDADYYADILFSTIKFGKTTFVELAPVVGNIAKLISVAGGSAEDMAGMLAIMTRNGIDTRVSITSLKGVVTALLKPSEALVEHLGGMTLEADGFAAIMEKVAGLPPADLAEMFPNVRALTGVVVAAEGLSEEVEKITALMAEGSPARIAYGKQSETLAQTWNKFKATLKATSIAIGDELAPTFKELFTDLISWLQENRQNFADFAKTVIDSIKVVIITLIKFKDILFVLGTTIGGMMIAQKIATVAMTAFGIATHIALGPVAAISAAIGLMIVAFMRIRKAVRVQREEEELLNKAITGTAGSVEVYNEAIDIQRAKLDKLIIDQERSNKAIGTATNIRGYDIEITRTAFREAIEQEKQKLAIMEDFAARQKVRDEEEKARLEEMAVAEQQAFLDKQRQMAEEQAAEDLAAAQRRAKIKEIEAIREAILLASETEQQRYDREKEHLEDLGLSYEEITAYLAIKFPETYEELSDISEEHWDMEALRVGKFKDAVRDEVKEIKKSWTDMLKDVQMVYTQLYTSISGAANAYFAMVTSQLDAEEAAGKDVAKERAALARKQFYYEKGMSIAQIIIDTASAVTAALSFPVLAIMVGALGAVQLGFALAQEAPPVPAFIRGGVTSLIDGGVFEGKPGIDTNQIAITSGEYIMPPQQTKDNIEELEAMRGGGRGDQPLIINPMPLSFEISGHRVFDSIVEFITEESDRGTYRIHPQVIRNAI